MPDVSDPEWMFRYYEDQWAHARHCESQRATLSIEALAVAGAAVAGYVTPSASHIRPILAAVVCAIGVGAFLAVRSIENAANIHICRAREARKTFPAVDKIAQTRGFHPLARYYLFLNGCVIGLGLLLLHSALR